MYKAAY
jgi:hypothetical protein